MIVHHFNTLLEGGAAIAARRLHDSLGRYGVRSRYYYGPWLASHEDESYCKFEYPPFEPTLSQKIRDRFNGKYWFRRNFQKNLNRFLVNKPDGYDLFSYARLPIETPIHSDGEKPDVVHLHWTAGMFDYPSFFDSIPDKLPIVWTLHDMNPFTGGCHYSWACRNYLSECGTCPQLNENRSFWDLSHQNWRIKRNSILDKTIHVVGDSSWLEQCSKESKLLSNAKSFRTIHYGLDTGIFYPKEKTVSRQLLSIERDAFVICFGAALMGTRRKGVSELFQALAMLGDIKILAIFFGDGYREIPSNSANLIFRSMGRIDSPELLSLIYSAADVFVIPSLQEAFGQTALEALACGTPVVGFRVGGIPDMVRSGVTGVLADPANVTDLAEKIRWMAEHPEERIRMGGNAREMVEKEFSLEVQAGKYAELYKALLR